MQEVQCNCKGCGAPLDLANKNNCDYCGSYFRPLPKKTVKKEERILGMSSTNFNILIFILFPMTYILHKKQHKDTLK